MSNGNGQDTPELLPDPPPIPEHKEICEHLVMFVNRADARMLVLMQVQRDIRLARQLIGAAPFREMSKTLRGEVRDLTGLCDAMDRQADRADKR